VLATLMLLQALDLDLPPRASGAATRWLPMIAKPRTVFWDSMMRTADWSASPEAGPIFFPAWRAAGR
jgi:hypothetical protein